MEFLRKMLGTVMLAAEGMGGGTPAALEAGKPTPEPAVSESKEAPAVAPAEKSAEAEPKIETDKDAAPAAKAEKAAREFAPTLLHEAISEEQKKSQEQKDPAAKDGKTPEKPADEKVAAKAEEKDKKTDAPEKKDDKDSATKDAPGEKLPAPVYEFKLPEDFKPEDLDNESMTAFKNVLGEDRVAPERAQQLLDMHIGEIKKVAGVLEQRQWDAFQNVTKTWRDETMADPVIGGSRHATAMNTVMNFVNEYGGDAADRTALLEVFKATGITNNRHFLSVLHRAGEAMSREARPHPVPPQRVAAKSMQDKRLGRYQNTTPMQNGTGAS